MLRKRIKVWILIVLVLCAMSIFSTFALAQEKKPIIGFAQDTLNQPWRNYQAVSVETALKGYGIDVIITDGLGRAEKQISNIEDMIIRGLDILICSPKEEGALTAIIEEVYNSGIPVVLIDRGITGSGYTTFVHADNFAISAMVADYMAEKFTQKYGEPKGNVVIIEGVPGSTTSVERDKGFKSRIAEKYPEIKVIASQPADYRRDKAMTLMEDYLQSFDQIDAVYTYADESTMGAIYAIENAGRRDEMLICSVNGTMEGLKAIIDGRMDCSPLYTNAAGPGVDFAMKILAGEKVPKTILLKPLMIDETNAKDLYNAEVYSPDPIPLSEQEYTVVEE